MKVLLIEDDKTLNQNITNALKSDAKNVVSIYDGKLAERALKQSTFDCIIMDVNLPEKNGFDLCKEFRLYNQHTPILILTAFSELEDKVQGFECGADDYLTKPFFMRELLMRINALIKRNINTKEESSILIADDIIINTKTKTVQRQDQFINLTPREYQILLMLIKNKSEIVSKKDLIKEIWGESIDINTNTIEVYINFLRNKLDKPFNKNSIKNKIGYGYYIDIE